MSFISPSSISSRLGSAARPVIISPSKPARFSITPNCPPQFEEAMPPVRTFLKLRLKRLVEGAPVPLSGPVFMMMTASGESGSSPGGVRSSSSRAARHLPPTYFLKYFSLIGKRSTPPVVRSTRA